MNHSFSLFKQKSTSFSMKVITGVVFTFLLGSMFVSLYLLSIGMNMTGSMSDCPFMTHEEVLCPMDLIDHLNAWKSAFVTVAPAVTTLFFVLGVVVLVLAAVPQFLFTRRKPIPVLQRQLRERTYAFSYRLLQELFSNGILNPKVF